MRRSLCEANAAVAERSGACTPPSNQASPQVPIAGEIKADLVSRRFIDLIPRDFARQHLIISQGVDEDGGTEFLCVADTSAPAAIFNAGVRLGCPVRTSIASDEAIARIIDEVYTARAPEISAQNGDDHAAEVNIDRLLDLADRDLLSTQGKGPIIKLVDALLFEALARGGASDVHVQPLADRTLVRYRLDGVLHTVRELPPHISQPVISRIKVMGKMDIAERRIPQDGRATVSIGQRAIDLRISTLPTSYGERAVIRLLDNSQHLCDFEKIGMPPHVARVFLDRASRTSGIILLTGPTGSGKTTTLYSTLRWIATGEDNSSLNSAGLSSCGGRGLNIMTIEDPIEYELSSVGLAISQSQVNTKKGVTFATGLRHILRQDPDVVMVGEIRDAETARIAIQSSLTGHLVFSTLHTNDAPSAVTRLIDLGVEPYLVSASLSAVLAQRLVRTIHQDCGGDGCEACMKTGFRGRTGLFELMAVNERIAELINRQAGLSEIRGAAGQAGLRTLREDGQRLIAAGATTQAEIDRVVPGGSEA